MIIDPLIMLLGSFIVHSSLRYPTGNTLTSDNDNYQLVFISVECVSAVIINIQKLITLIHYTSVHIIYLARCIVLVNKNKLNNHSYTNKSYIDVNVCLQEYIMVNVTTVLVVYLEVC